ncbi:hypothetical protein GOV05_01065 [Candidatus Woesearchaeota archaeon]|nr:hypothetical protein [Candidatus Woesearchaeota archaeon]
MDEELMKRYTGELNRLLPTYKRIVMKLKKAGVHGNLWSLIHGTLAGGTPAVLAMIAMVDTGQPSNDVLNTILVGWFLVGVMGSYMMMFKTLEKEVVEYETSARQKAS